MEDNSQVYDTPSLQQEAEANGIEIMESSTDQIQYDDNEGVPPVETEGEEPSTNTEGNAEEGDESTADNKEEGEKDLQEEVDKHSKAISSIKEDLKGKGVDFNSAVKEYETKGSLSEETIEALNKAGYPPEVIEAFIEGRVAMEERFTKAIYESVGGEKEYRSIVNWASKNLTKKSIDAFNRAIDNNNINAITLMLEGMKAKMVAKMGTAKKSIHGGASAPNGSPKGYNSKADVIKAMSDPRYGRDAGYTRMVEQQMWATNF
jgi:hypothetical protein